MDDLKKWFDQDNLSFEYEFGPDKYVALHDLVGHKAITIDNEKRAGLNYICVIFINYFNFENTYELCRSEIDKQNEYTRPHNWKILQKKLKKEIRKRSIKGMQLILLKLLNCFELIEIRLLKDLTKSKNINRLVCDTNKKLGSSGFYIKSERSYNHENSYILKFSTTR